MRLIGIDPGSTGAVALLQDGRLLDVADTPVLRTRRGKTEKAMVNPYALHSLLRAWLPVDQAVLEHVGGIMGQSASAAFNFGRATGMAEAAVAALGIPLDTLPPQAWRAYLKLRRGKDESRALAVRTWPSFADSFARVKDDGRAEAALIGWVWGRKHAGWQRGSTDVFA